MFTGFLEDLRRRLDVVDIADPVAVRQVVEEHDPRAADDLEDEEPEDSDELVVRPCVMSALIFGTWAPSPGEQLNWLDWHEEVDFLEKAGPSWTRTA